VSSPASKKLEPRLWALVLEDRTLDLECESGAEERDFFAGQFGRMVADVGLLQRTLLYVFQAGLWAPPHLAAEAAAAQGEGAGAGEEEV
jgi:hypothetical protein